MPTPAQAPRVPDDMHDAPEDLAPSHPLHEALALCGELLVPCHDGAAARGARAEERRSALALWSAAVGALAVLLAVAGLAAAAAGRWAGAGRALAIAELVLAAACFVLLAVRAGAFRKSAWLADRTRIERCASLKFRYLLDPSLWSRRGREAGERTEQFRADAAGAAAIDAAGAAAWADSDAVPVARTIPVGSAIDPHTVHTLMDYYQARRIDPHLARLSREAEERSGLDAFASPAAWFLASVLLVLAAAAAAVFRKSAAPGPSATPWVLSGIAAALPFAAAVVFAFRARVATAAARRRAGARRRALAEISERLQKVSGAEAIFRELGFCEDVLEGDGKDRLRAAFAAGWLG